MDLHGRHRLFHPHAFNLLEALCSELASSFNVDCHHSLAPLHPQVPLFYSATPEAVTMARRSEAAQGRAKAKAQTKGKARTKTTAMKKLTKFHKFPELPPELRLYIIGMFSRKQHDQSSLSWR